MDEKQGILIVDDDESTCRSLALIFGKHGYETETAGTGREAMEKAQRRFFNMALLDIKLPDMKGTELLAPLKKMHPDMVVLMITAHASLETAVRALKEGASAYIIKPLDMDEVLATAKEVLEKQHLVMENRRLYQAAQRELAERKRAEEELRKHRDHLEELEGERTADLVEVNEQLKGNLQELQASEERFRSLVMTIPDIIYRIDKEGYFTFVNDAVEKLGYEPAELVGKHFSEIILPAEVESVSRSIVLKKYAGKITGDENAPKLFDERRTGKRKTTGLEVKLVIKSRKASKPGLLLPIGEDAVIVEINSSGMWEINPDAKRKELIGTVGVIRDITQRKILERNLEEAYRGLEIKVEERTAELSEANKALKAEIAERQRREKALRVSHQFLEIVSKHMRVEPMLKEFAVEVQKLTGCAAVGIRVLDEEGNIPYKAYVGFSQRFYESESPLSIKSDQCMCINVIKGTTDPKIPFYTKRGSFCMNGTTSFLASISEEEKGPTRNVCNEFGYESVALVPLRLGDRILGLIHVADPQENMVPLEMVDVLEEEAVQLGMSMQRALIEEELEKHREHLEEMVRERTAELRTIVNAMSGREIRMAELKKTIKKLRTQLKEAGLTPVANDPLKEMSEE